jgi:hypothetical protein
MCRILHEKRLFELFFSPSTSRMIQSRRMSWVRCTTRMWEKRKAYRLLVGKPERMKTDIKMDFSEIG